MRRETPRTLFSLSPAYQVEVSAADYEVIVVENGSPEPLAAEDVTQFGPNYRYLWIDNASPSPAQAINRGVALSRAPYVGIMIDGARIATPGIVHLALLGLQRFERAVVGTVGFHLGPDTQMYSLRHGYNQTVEDEWLERSDWRNHGYRLFEIGALAGSSPRAWLDIINESNLIFLPRALFDDLGGYDERFTTPGGGIVNLDFYRRACALPNSTLITLFGEATFHQVHGGAITNQPATELPQRLQRYGEEYLRIRGTPFERSTRPALLLGYPRPEIMPWLQKACDFAAAMPSAPTKEEWGEASRLDDSFPTRVPLLPAGKEEGEDVFRLLASLGLRDDHDVLELVEGSVVVGPVLIPHLQPRGYYGLEFAEPSLREALLAALGPDLIETKQPYLARHDDFNLDAFGYSTSLDFIVVPTLFDRVGSAVMRRCLTAVRNMLKPRGLLVAALGAGARAGSNNATYLPDSCQDRGKAFVRLCGEAGLHCRQLDWPHPARTWCAAAIDLARLRAGP